MQPGCCAMQALYLFLSNSPLNVAFCCIIFVVTPNFNLRLTVKLRCIFFQTEPTRIDTAIWGAGGRAAPGLCAGGWEDEAHVLHTDSVGPQVQVLEWLGKLGGAVFLNVK
jgi:hypothetical protein